ncbi:hypothetical protein K502DRAFT_330533 [Neoconidiobolus thromboides FSU 785]|nr:hypothetical protein K502DRAFT_330533 [Neoconidiobolus thromboides FSU 785]
MRFSFIHFYSYLILLICICSISINAAPADDKNKGEEGAPKEEQAANVAIGECVSKCDPKDISCKAKCSGSSDLTATGIKDKKACIESCYTNKDFISDSTKSSQCVKDCNSGISTPTTDASVSKSANSTEDKSKATQSKNSSTSGALSEIAFTAKVGVLYAFFGISLFYLII